MKKRYLVSIAAKGFLYDSKIFSGFLAKTKSFNFALGAVDLIANLGAADGQVTIQDLTKGTITSWLVTDSTGEGGYISDDFRKEIPVRIFKTHEFKNKFEAERQEAQKRTGILSVILADKPTKPPERKSC